MCLSLIDHKIEIHKKLMPIKLTNNTILDNTENCLKWALFITNLLNNLYLRSANNGEEETNIEKILERNVNLPGTISVLTNVIYLIVLGQMYRSHYRSVSRITFNMKRYLFLIIRKLMSQLLTGSVL